MAYLTGSATSGTNLRSILTSAATANGWTLTGGNVLHKGSSFVVLNDALYQLTIDGCTASDGTTGLANNPRAIYIDGAHWPVTYHIFIHANPDVIVCVLNYNAFRIQVIMFGDIVKTHSSAFTGGNFYFATRKFDSTLEDTSLVMFDLTQLRSGNDSLLAGGGYTAVIPFAEQYGSTYPAPNYKLIHAEVDGQLWATSASVTYTDTTLSSLYRSPNTWNQQTHLVPMNLQFKMASSLYNPLGYIEHIRLVRVDNYNIGDIVTISPDQWMVFPWTQKDTVYRNGTNNGSGNGYSGTLGFAVRYDGI